MKLTVTASNRDRLKLNDPASKLFLKSIQWQEFCDFELLIVDGGSQNYDEIKEYFENNKSKIPMRIVQHKIGEAFERALLNNVGIRNAKGEYVMTTDVDMIFAPKFVSTLVSLCSPNVMIESRTMYLKSDVVKNLHDNDKNSYNIEELRRGKIKKRTTAGGCQCLHKNDWIKVRAFDENFVGWGSEDFDLLTRAEIAGIKVKWMGESLDTIMLFHQAHYKSSDQVKKDLEYQEKNKKILHSPKNYIVNPKGWGGIYE